MTIETDRRGFLFGALATLAAASTVTPMRALEIVTQPSEAWRRLEWRRLIASFDALDGGSFDINLFGNADNCFQWAQLEQGHFPTSYIPTDANPGFRDREIAGIGMPQQSVMVNMDDIFVHRKSPATIFDEDRQDMVLVPPNTPRHTKRGLLIEKESVNFFPYSDKPRSQRVPLERGHWQFSCWVKGAAPRIEIVASDGRAFVPAKIREERL